MRSANGLVVGFMPFVFIDHTADMGVRITAGTLNQLFELATERR